MAGIHELLQLIRIEQLAAAGVRDTPDFRAVKRPGSKVEPSGPAKMSPAAFARMVMT